jgi:hypothetical protein
MPDLLCCMMCSLQGSPATVSTDDDVEVVKSRKRTLPSRKEPSKGELQEVEKEGGRGTEGISGNTRRGRKSSKTPQVAKPPPKAINEVSSNLWFEESVSTLFVPIETMVHAVSPLNFELECLVCPPLLFLTSAPYPAIAGIVFQGCEVSRTVMQIKPMHRGSSFVTISESHVGAIFSNSRQMQTCTCTEIHSIHFGCVIYTTTDNMIWLCTEQSRISSRYETNEMKD